MPEFRRLFRGSLTLFLVLILQDSYAGSDVTANSEIKTVVSTQAAEGVTQSDFNAEFLKVLESYTIERIKLKYKDVLINEELPYKNMDVAAESVYTEFNDKKLAIIRLQTSFGSHQVVVMGIIKNELRRVLCYRNDTQTIPVTYGVCAKKIEEVFQVKIAP